MTTPRTYVPILKWKMGEYQALSRLTPAVKKFVVPLIEIPPAGYDFETAQVKKTLDEHLDGFGKKLHSKWDARPCFIDMKHIPKSDRMSNGEHYLEYVFRSARQASCDAIPVVALDSDKAYRNAVSEICSADKRGACLRLSAEDFDSENISNRIKKTLDSIAIGIASIDLVVDLGTPSFIPRQAHIRMVRGLLTEIPGLHVWRSLILAGTSYPDTLQKIEKPVDQIPRLEWAAYRGFIEKSHEDMRLPAFADYGVAHPSLVELDMRFVKPFAKLRYTTGENWYIAQGKTVRENGFEQYREMCSDLTEEDFFDSELPSAGDQYIADCSEGDAKTGNLSTWVWVATNRHISKVVSDLANLHDSLGTGVL